MKRRKIASFNQRILFERLTHGHDAYANDIVSWEPWYSCAAYASTNQREERDAAARTVEEESISFEVRACRELDGITSTGWRVVFRGRPYNILLVDRLNYSGTGIRICCILDQPMSRGDV